MFSALRHRNFRLYVSGQFISLIGTWMQQLATSWMVYRLTDSPLWLGISAFSSQIPMFAFGLFTGVVVDRVNKHRLLLWTQSLSAIQATILAVLTFLHVINVYELIALNFVLGSINSIDMPARQSFVVEMIGDRKDLPNAIAINSSVVNGSRLIGPAVAGVTIGLFGEGVCFLLNALSYLAVLGALLLMHVERKKAVASGTSLREGMRVGFRTVFQNEAMRSVLLLIMFMSLIGMPFMALFPALAAQVPGGNAKTLGWLTGAFGCGALLGTLYLARKATPVLARVIAFCSLLFSVFLILLSRVQSLPLMLFCVFMTGVGMMLLLSSSNTVLQSVVQDEKRGRVMAFFGFAMVGISPFGGLLLGAVAQKFGLGETFFISGVISLAGSLLFARRSGLVNEGILEAARANLKAFPRTAEKGV